MLFCHPRNVTMHLCNACGALLVGLFFAFVGLNAASGCGQGGQCIALTDFVTAPPVASQIASLSDPAD